MASGRLVDYLGHGNIADRPATPTLTTDAIGVWWSDDTDEMSIWDGVAWHEDVGGGGAGLVDSDYGDITVSGSGTVMTIDNDAVTYAKMQNTAAASRLLGRGSASGAGNVEEITLGSGLSMTGTTLSASGAGLSDGDYGDITVSGSGTAMAIDNDTVTYAKMQNVSATSRVLGRKTSGAGDTEELTLSELLDFVGSAAQGDILYRGASGWTRLAAGTAGKTLQTNGTGADPSWVTPTLSLVSTQTVTGSSANTVTFSSLDLATDGTYILVSDFTSASGSITDLRLRANGDSTTGNYVTEVERAQAGTISGATSDNKLSDLNASAEMHVEIIVNRLNSGQPVAQYQGVESYSSGGTLQTRRCSWTRKNTANVTSLTLVASGNFAVGSVFKLFKRTP
jgi:hypothetical protein